MSPRTKLLTGAALRRAIREEIERFWNEEVRDDPQIVTTLFACQACPKTFQTRGEALAHDIDVHLAERVSRLSRKAGGQGT